MSRVGQVKIVPVIAGKVGAGEAAGIGVQVQDWNRHGQQSVGTALIDNIRNIYRNVELILDLMFMSEATGNKQNNSYR